MPVSAIEACDLSDDGAGWNHSPHAATDPIANAQVARRSRARPHRLPRPGGAARCGSTFHLGFPGPIGGGGYNRAASLALMPGQTVVQFPHPDHPTLQAAPRLPARGRRRDRDRHRRRHPGPLAIAAADAAEIELRAADGVRPILRLAAPLALSGGADARITLNGLTIEGAVEIGPDADGVSLKEVTFRHATLIPGLGFDPAGAPRSPGAISLAVATTGLELFLDRCVTGPVRMTDTTNAEIRDSIVDAAAAESIDSAEGIAIAGPGPGDPAGALTIIASTVVGRIHARSFPLVSDSILFARSPDDDSPPVRAVRRQVGCMRFSFVPRGSVTPRRFRCQPQLAIDQAIEARHAELGGPVPAAERALIALRIARRLVPSFTALRASHPAYAQLRRSAPEEIRRGASDEGEMGAWHLLFQPQREANLRIRLEEYLRFGLEAGLFFET